MDSNLGFIRVEGNLLSLHSFRILAHFARNAQAFTERTYRLPAVALMAVLRPLISVENPVLATRLLYLPLRGMSRDRLDLLGEEYFTYALSSQLIKEGVRQIEKLQAVGKRIVLISDELDHLIRPLALHLGADFLLTNRLEFRDDLATGRLLEPVIPSLGVTAGLSSTERGESMGWEAAGEKIDSTRFQPAKPLPILPAQRSVKAINHPIVQFANGDPSLKPLSVRKSLSGKKILLIGCTGFIGKVWLTMLLDDLPEIGRVFLLIRRHGTRSALQRFEKIVAESPTFKPFHEKYGDRLGEFLAERIEAPQRNGAGGPIG